MVVDLKDIRREELLKIPQNQSPIKEEDRGDHTPGVSKEFEDWSHQRE
jgi:hypothetical protein